MKFRSVSLSTGLLLAAVGYGLVAQGAFYRVQTWILISLVCIAAVLSFLAHPVSVSELRSAPVLAALALSGWAGIRSLFSPPSPGGLTSAMVLVSIAAVVVLARRVEDWEASLLVQGLGLMGAVIALIGWGAVVFHLTPQAEASSLWRAASTLTYPNTAAGVLVPIALLGCAKAVAQPARRLPVIVALLLVVGVVATLSRAGVVVLFVGGLLLAGLLGIRKTVVSLGPIALGGVLATIGLVPSFSIHGRPQPALAAGALCVGGGVAVLMRSLSWGRAAAMLTVLVLLAAGAFSQGIPIPRGGQFDLESDRATMWRETLRLVEERPWIGVGAGSFAVSFRDAAGRIQKAQFAHNEYLQVLAQYGAIGLLLMGGGLAATAVAVMRSQPRKDWMKAGAVAGLAALLLHSSVDFLWHSAVVPVVGALLVGIALRSKSNCEPSSSSRRTRLRVPVAGIVGIVIVGGLAIPLVTNHWWATQCPVGDQLLALGEAEENAAGNPASAGAVSVVRRCLEASGGRPPTAPTRTSSDDWPQ